MCLVLTLDREFSADENTTETVTCDTDVLVGVTESSCCDPGTTHHQPRSTDSCHSGVTPIGQGWTNSRGLRGLGGPKPNPNFLYILIFRVLGVSHLFYSTADFFVNVHFAFHHCFVFNGNFSSYFNNNKLFCKFKMGYGAFYVICPRASTGLQSICYATELPWNQTRPERRLDTMSALHA